MTISDVLTLDRIVFLRSATKADALGEVIDLLQTAPNMPSRTEIEAAIVRREEMMSTGIGMGLAVPHIRHAGVRGLTMAVGVHRDGLTDYVSLDNQPVHIIAMIAAPAGHHAEYIRLLAQVVTVLKKEEARKGILAAQSPAEVCEILCTN